jgi:ABC-type transporter Mla subunit MlaD
MTPSKRRDAETLRRLDETRKAYERLRAERIRAESEVERLSRELEQAREQARAEFGTDDETEIERLIQTAAARNAGLVDEFSALIRDLETRLQTLGSERR